MPRKFVGKGNSNLSENRLIKKSIQIRPDQDKALKLMLLLETGKYETEYDIIIKALDKFIPKKYFNMAQNNSAEDT